MEPHFQSFCKIYRNGLSLIYFSLLQLKIFICDRCTIQPLVESQNVVYVSHMLIVVANKHKKNMKKCLINLQELKLGIFCACGSGVFG